MLTMKSNYFYGNKVSDYGIEHKRVDYGTLAKAFDGVLNNDIMEKTWGIIGYWEQESGFVDNSEEIEELKEKVENLEELLEVVKEEKMEEIENQISELEEQIDELENEQDNQPDIFQYFIVDNNGAELLKEINEIVFYNEELDMYVWGVTHYGTSWDYVLTDIKIEVDD